MSKNSNFTQLDTHQIVNRKFDQDNDADRVYIVGGEKIDIQINEEKLLKAVKDGLSNIQFDNKPSESTQIQVVEKNIFIPQIEIKEVEKQIIVPQIEYRTIEIPVFTERIVTVEKPVIIEKTVFQEIIKERHYPTVMKVCAVIQAIVVTVLLIINLLKK